jgi:hypothetical protein
MRALAFAYCHKSISFGQALLQAELGDEKALGQALELLDQLPPINRRRLLCAYNSLSRELRQAS